MKGMSRLLHLFPHGPGNAEPGEPIDATHSQSV